MFKDNKLFILVLFFIVSAGALYFYYRRDGAILAPGGNAGDRGGMTRPEISLKPDSVVPEKAASSPAEDYNLYHFGSLEAKGIFKFSGQIAKNWSVEYVPEIEAVNIFLNQGPADSSLENSQIFIRYFEADRFLTLSTVEVLAREETEIRSHPAVRYKIIKKSEAANFYRQPLWRSQEHQLIDIRYSQKSPSIFYVIAKNPALSDQDFKSFIGSLFFYNDADSWTEPLSQSKSRLSKKPFALYVDPDNSPVSPERFSGWHTGADLEILGAEELQGEVPVSAVCGGRLSAKRIMRGYGGVAIQECRLADDLVQVLYGHLDYQSIIALPGDFLRPGQGLANLGADRSEETDGERKHLHLAIHRGSSLDWRGYVSEELALGDWLDPCLFICQ